MVYREYSDLLTWRSTWHIIIMGSSTHACHLHQYVFGLMRLMQVVATAPSRSPTAHQLEVAVQVLHGYSARSKKKPHEFRTLQFTILRCFLSFAIVI
jgi:hypothetical protein